MDNSNETVVDKAVNFVKDVFGIQHDDAPEVVANPEYPETASEAAADNAISLDPNAYIVNSAGVVSTSEQLTPGTFATPMGESETERLRREVDEHPRDNIAMENADLVRRENGV